MENFIGKPRASFIPIAQPELGKEEERLVLEGLRSGWVSSAGKFINEFEESFAAFCNTKYGISTSNGTTALHLCLAASGIGPGDEVLIPSLTFVATANAVSYTGAKPVFIDSEMETWNLDPEKIKEKINKRTKAIIPVHLYGHPANMGIILAIAKKYGLLVIEDAAEAHGALYKGRKVGSLGDAACFSFYGNKIITTGEGGMIVTGNRLFAEKVKVLRDHGMSKKRKFYHPKLGFNYRMTNLQAALGLGQMKRIDEFVERKITIAELYTKHLTPLSGRITLPPHASWAKSVYWMYSILIPNKGLKKRDNLIKELKKQGVDSRPFFFPLHSISRYKTAENLINATNLSKSGINLPSSFNLKETDIKYICHKIMDFLN